jgi:hypothetical protein
VDEKTAGSWLIHHTHRLQRAEFLPGYDRIYTAGKAGILLSAISADRRSELSRDRVNALATASKITSLELPGLLAKLQERELIDQTTNGVSVLGVTTQTATLVHTAKLFSAIDPTPTERAVLAIAEAASNAPISHGEAMEIGDQHALTKVLAQQTISESCDVGFVDVESLAGGQQLFFNGNLFRRDNAEKIKRVLDSLGPSDQSVLKDATLQLQSRGCIDVTEIARMLGKQLFEKVMSVGLLDINVVSNSKEETGFVTLPSAFSKFSTSTIDDAFDLAKAFVSSITYGMTKSPSHRGRIDFVAALLRALIRGEPIGPVPAIAEDYKILEIKGVVQVKDGHKSGRYGPMMWLLKKEVGELALQVIMQGDASDQSLNALPSAAVSRYRGPEENQQIVRKRQVKDSPTTTNDILRVLRTTGAK